MRLVGFAAIVLLSLLAISVAQTSLLVFSVDSLAANIVLNDFSISDSSITQGQADSFTVTFENTGNVQTTAQAHVYIFNSNNVQVDSFDYTSTSITPNQQKSQVYSWSNDNLGAGTYTAKANVTFIPYNSSNSVSNTLTLTFQITSGGGGGGGGGGGHQFEPINPLQPILPTTPVPLPPTITPVQGGIVDFVKFPVLKEILAGQSAIQSMQMVNRQGTSQKVTMEVQGVSADWVSFTDAETQLLPNEKRTMDFAISVPVDAPAGDYLVRVKAISEQGTSSDFMIMRVKSSGSSRPMPISLRTVEVDRTAKKTTVVLRLRNPTKKTLQRITLMDSVPEDLKDNQITFLDKQGAVAELDGRRTIQWEIPELLQNDETQFAYTMDGVLGNYAPYVGWHLADLQISDRVDLSNLVSILDLSATAMQPGKGGQVTATVLYVGEEPLDATMSLEAPSGFIVDPAFQAVTLQPRKTFTMRFNIIPPAGAADTQLVRFVLFTDSGQVSARLPIIISSGAGPAEAGLLRVTASDVAVVGIVALAVGVGYALLRSRGGLGGGGSSRFDPERMEYAKAVAKSIKVK